MSPEEEKKRDARIALIKAIDANRDAGIDVVCVSAEYNGTISAHFSTRISVSDHPDSDVDQNHVMHDVYREIANEWSAVIHKK